MSYSVPHLKRDAKLLRPIFEVKTLSYSVSHLKRDAELLRLAFKVKR